MRWAATRTRRCIPASTTTASPSLCSSSPVSSPPSRESSRPARTSSASPASMFGYELDCITVVFLGGFSFLGGTGRHGRRLLGDRPGHRPALAAPAQRGVRGRPGHRRRSPAHRIPARGEHRRPDHEARSATNGCGSRDNTNTNRRVTREPPWSIPPEPPPHLHHISKEIEHMRNQRFVAAATTIGAVTRSRSGRLLVNRRPPPRANRARTAARLARSPSGSCRRPAPTHT